VEDSVGERRRVAVSEVLISRMNVGVEGKVREAEDLYSLDIDPVEAEICQGARPPAEPTQLSSAMTGNTVLGPLTRPETGRGKARRDESDMWVYVRRK
jgi:hypothetical protein